MQRSLRLSMLSVFLIASAMLPMACKRKAADGMMPLADDKTSICLFDGLGVRATAAKGGKFVASLSLGETVRWTGDRDKDENGKDYLKVTLSDGHEGWASAAGLVTGAKVGAVKDDTVLYKRPDPLTATAQKVLCMSIVAVIQEKDGWVQLVGEGRRTLGWVNTAVVAFEREEVTTAILATKKLRQKDGLDRAAKVEAIARLAPNPASPFIQRLRERAADANVVVPVQVPNTDYVAPKTEDQ